MICENIYYKRFFSFYLDLLDYNIENNGYFVFDEKYFKSYFDRLIYIEKKEYYERVTGISYDKYLKGDFDTLEELLNSAYSDKVFDTDFSYMFEPIMNLLRKYALENYNNKILNDRRIYYLELDKIKNF